MSFAAIKLRDYQQQSIDALINYFMENDGNPLVVLPTGAGKSICIGDFIKKVMGYPDQRIIMLTHVKELIEQNYEKLITLWPNAPAGIYSAGLKRRDKHDDIIFAGIQSVHSKSDQFGKFDLIIIDECHLISPGANTMYQRFIADQKSLNPYIKIIGYTATPFRTSTGDITTSKGAIFDAICYEKPMIELINEGYLSPVVGKRTETEIDLSGVKTRGGEYVNKDLQRATDQEAITKAAVAEIIAYGADRRSWLLFCAGVQHAEHVRDELIDNGITCACVTGDTPADEREQILIDYKSGAVKAISNCDVLTTGFDAPNTDLIALLRGTQSPGLYVQMVGRGTRLAEGKVNCLVLDFAGNVMKHGPVDQVRPWTPSERKKGEAPSKVCPECNTIVAAVTKVCSECKYEFPYEEAAKHNASSDDVAIMSTESLINEHEVTRVFFARHDKRNADGSPPTICVSYFCGLQTFKEWIPIFHDGFAKNRAKSWWSKFVPGFEFPQFNEWIDFDDRFDQIFDVMETHYQQPFSIVVNHSGKYPGIVNYVQCKPETDENPERTDDSTTPTHDRNNTANPIGQELPHL